MRQHITVVGALHIGLGVLGILTALIVLVSMIGPGVLVHYLEGESEPLTVLTVIGVSVALFLTVVSMPGIIGGVGLLKLRPWARYLILILAVLDLFNIPIGTAVGAYSLWVLMQGETEQLFVSRVTQ